MTEVYLSNMSVSGLGMFDLKYTGKVAKAIGADGVEHVPTFKGFKQIQSGHIPDEAMIRSWHWGWRNKEKRGKGQLMKVLLEIPKNPMAGFAGLATYLNNPMGIRSEAYFRKMQEVMGLELPIVLYDRLLHKPAEKLPFKNMSIQITPEVLKDNEIHSVQGLEDWLGKHNLASTYDFQHSATLPEDLKKHVMQTAKEVHVRTGLGMKEKRKIELGFLQKCKAAERVVIELGIYFPWILPGMVKDIRSNLRNR